MAATSKISMQQESKNDVFSLPAYSTEVNRLSAWPSHLSEPNPCNLLWYSSCVQIMKRTLCLFVLWKRIKLFAGNQKIFSGRVGCYWHIKRCEEINKGKQTLWDASSHWPRVWLSTLLADPHLKDSVCSALIEACMVSHRHIIICNRKPLSITYWLHSFTSRPVNLMRY